MKWGDEMEHDWRDLDLVREALSEEASSTLQSSWWVDGCIKKTWSETRRTAAPTTLSTKKKARELGPLLRNLKSVSLALIQDAVWDILSLKMLGENPSLACQLLVAASLA